MGRVEDGRRARHTSSDVGWGSEAAAIAIKNFSSLLNARSCRYCIPFHIKAFNICDVNPKAMILLFISLFCKDLTGLH